jgi:hypothetical protein
MIFRLCIQFMFVSNVKDILRFKRARDGSANKKVGSLPPLHAEPARCGWMDDPNTWRMNAVKESPHVVGLQPGGWAWLEQSLLKYLFYRRILN